MEVPPGEDLRLPTDLIFADGGDDIIYTDGTDSTYVFGGPGYDTLVAEVGLQNGVQSVAVDLSSLNSWGAEGVATRDALETRDQFFGIEHIVLDYAAYKQMGENSFVFNTPKSGLKVEFQPGEKHSVLLTGADDSQFLKVTNSNDFDFSRDGRDNTAVLKLGGEIGKYSIDFDGQALNVEWRNSGVKSFQGIDKVLSRNGITQHVQLADMTLEVDGHLIWAPS